MKIFGNRLHYFLLNYFSPMVVTYDFRANFYADTQPLPYC
jgi:hypothetical protein